MNKDSFDVVVVGGGPGGYVAALRAAQLGLSTALVEKAQLGGVCLNWGCIPTKALLQSAHLVRTFKRSSTYGIEVAGEVTVNLAAMVQRSRSVADKLSKGIARLLRKSGVDLLTGHARLQGQGSLVVQSSQVHATLKAESIILATGARSRLSSDLPAPDGKSVWTYRDALCPTTTPRRLLIVGAGSIGIEFATFYSAIGSSVTVVESAERILPQEDIEVSSAVASSLVHDGVDIRVGAGLLSTRRSAHGWCVRLAGLDVEVEVDVILLAIGVVGNVEDIGLENTKARVEHSHIVVDEMCCTHEEGLFAIGDVAAPPRLAHKASREALIVANRIAGLPAQPIRRERIPSCTFSQPQIASVGLTEQEARLKGDVRVGKFPFAANGKSIAAGAADGFVKLVFSEESGELLGAHLVGEEVTELVHGLAVAQTLETTELDLMDTIFPHPTLSEAMQEAVLAAYGRALHI